MNVEYDDELEQISEGLMSEYWMTKDTNKYKIKKKIISNKQN